LSTPTTFGETRQLGEAEPARPFTELDSTRSLRLN
jgi:hypothetical protein